MASLLTRSGKNLTTFSQFSDAFSGSLTSTANGTILMSFLSSLELFVAALTKSTQIFL